MLETKPLAEAKPEALAPGLALGTDCESWLRWCTARAPAQLLEGARRPERFVRR